MGRNLQSERDNEVASQCMYSWSQKFVVEPRVKGMRLLLFLPMIFFFFFCACCISFHSHFFICFVSFASYSLSLFFFHFYTSSSLTLSFLSVTSLSFPSSIFQLFPPSSLLLPLPPFLPTSLSLFSGSPYPHSLSLNLDIHLTFHSPIRSSTPFPSIHTSTPPP